MPLSGEAIRSMNFVDDISGMLRRILVSIQALSDDERARVLEHILNADPSYASLIAAVGPGKRTAI